MDAPLIFIGRLGSRTNENSRLLWTNRISPTPPTNHHNRVPLGDNTESSSLRMDVVKTVGVLALQRTINLQQQLTRHEEKINELANVQSEQSERIERLSLVVGQLRGLVRRLIDSNERLRRQIGGLLFVMRLTVMRRRNVDYRFWSTMIALISARLLSRLFLVDTMSYLLTIPLGTRTATARKTVSVISTIALVAYLQPRIERLLGVAVAGK